MARKNVMTILMLALLVITVLLIWQWNNFKMEAKDEPDGSPTGPVSQHIEITRVEGKLKISQKIENLENRAYSILLPNGGKGYLCETGGGTFNCSEKETEVKGNFIHFTYELPIDPKKDDLLLENWAVVLEGVPITHTAVQISETAYLDSSWVAGAELVADEKMDFVHYYLFERDTGAFPLFWQQEPLSVRGYEGFTVYGNPHFQIDGKTSEIFNERGKKTIPNLVFTEVDAPRLSQGLIVLPKNMESREISHLWVKQYVEDNLLKVSKDERWLTDVIAGFLLRTKPEGEKAGKIYDEVNGSLKETELSRFLELIKKGGGSGVKDLDKWMTEAKQRQTDFFTLNGKESDPLYPLYFYIEKPVTVRNGAPLHFKIYVKEPAHYYPMKKVIQALGYTYRQITDEEIYISNQTDSYRFYYGKNIFVFNEEEYGLYSDQRAEPFMKIDGELYIQEDLLVSLFHVQIIEYESKVIIF